MQSVHHTIRLKGYDYSQNGLYFVTICTQNRENIFGEIVDGKMKLNSAGNMIAIQWNNLINRFDNIELDEYTVMPNHFHGIIHIVGAPLVGARNNYAGINKTRAGTRPAPTINPTVGEIIGAFKSITTHAYIENVMRNNWPPFDKRLWQRNYYEHIIRNEEEYLKIKEYIRSNPSMWERDRNNLKKI